MSKKIYYNRTNTCDQCGKSLKPGKSYREFNNKGEWTGKWLCDNCWYHFEYKKRLNSYVNMVKSLRNYRTGNLDPNSTTAKGLIFEEVTCKWRGVKNLNIENDNFTVPIDHSKDQELGVIQTKGATYSPFYRWWNARSSGEIIEFDNLIFYCADKYMKIIERIYIFPIEFITRRSSITIVKDPSRGPSVYEEYRINDDICKYVSSIFKTVKFQLFKI